MRRLVLLLGWACAAVPFASPAGTSPDLSFILQGRAIAAPRDAAAPPGFLLPAGEDGHDHPAAPGRGLLLDHTEVMVSGSIDRLFDGQLSLGVSDGDLEVEEAWFQTRVARGGAALRAGRFLSDLGHLNSQHQHEWDFADASRVQEVMLGGQLIHDGLQVRWVAPARVLFELVGEAARGQTFPGGEGDEGRAGFGARTVLVRLGDRGPSGSWRVGLGQARAAPRQRPGLWRAGSGEVRELGFSGRSRLWAAEIVLRWAPGGELRRGDLRVQAEYFQRREDGQVGCLEGACAGGQAGTWRTRQSGLYAQAVYRLGPRWQAGYRLDRLYPGRPGLEGLPDAAGRPSRQTALLEYAPTGSSRLRAQIAKDRSGRTAQIIGTVQYVMSFGAHGHHSGHDHE